MKNNHQGATLLSSNPVSAPNSNLIGIHLFFRTERVGNALFHVVRAKKSLHDDIRSNFLILRGYFGRS